jgi:hypothetical protein
MAPHNLNEMVNSMISLFWLSQSVRWRAPEPTRRDYRRRYESFSRNEGTASATEPFPRNHPFHRWSANGPEWSRSASSCVIGASLKAASAMLAVCAGRFSVKSDRYAHAP